MLILRKLKNFQILFLTFLLLFDFQSHLSAFEQQCLIIPGKKVGEIDKYSDIDHLKQYYGAVNVINAKIGVGEGETKDGTLVVRNGETLFEIFWHTKYKKPKYIRVKNSGINCYTANNIKFNMTLKDVEIINKKKFKLTGFEWDYPGYSISWEGGILSKKLQLIFKKTKSISLNQYINVIGDKSLFSDDKYLRKLVLVVDEIIISID